MSILIFILILAVLVLVHEFGHFIAAKRAGVLVEEFGFGFPPRLFGVKRGETTYTVNLIPLGGFVKLYGEEYHEDEEPNIPKHRAFVHKKHSTKALIILAGVMMNVILASVLYYGLLATNGFKSDPVVMLSNHDFAFGTQQSQVVATAARKGSPAAAAGITSGDIITGFQAPGDASLRALNSPDELIQNISRQKDKKVAIELINIKNGQKKLVEVVPKYDSTLKRAVIGIGLAEVATISYATPVERTFSGFFHSYNMASYSLNIFGQIIGESYKAKDLELVGEAVSGPVGIFYAVSDTVTSSGERLLRNLLDITAILSISLAVVNTLPFPALDGGRFAFILYEWIARRRVNQSFEKYFNLAGIIILLTLAVVISINDVFKLMR